MKNDLISRQAAITIPVTPKEDREYQTFNLDDAYEQAWDDLQKRIEQLPSAQRTGRWIEHKDYPGLAYLCSECDYFTTLKSYYCPYCGARMEESE